MISEKKPIIIVNFKTYEKATGNRALLLAKKHRKVAKRTGTKIIIAVQNTDVYHVSHSVSIPVLAQHADPVEFGPHTGSDLPEDLLQNGAWGVLINHSEDRIPLQDIEKTIKRCRQVGLKTVVCAESRTKAFEIAKMKPDYLAFEDPELIGTGRSVSRLKPESVKKFAEMVRDANKKRKKKIIPLCGAGISNQQDVIKAMELGMDGVLVSSAIVKARNVEKELESFVGS